MEVKIQKLNESFIRVLAEPSVLQELSERFTFSVEGAKFSPAFKKGNWDGKIRLLNKKQVIYAGLAENIATFCAENNYSIEYDNFKDEFSEKEAIEFIKSLNLPAKYQLRDYQFDSFIHAIRNKRQTILSPTSSGKSLLIYLITRYYNAKLTGRTLIIVPTINLVSQLASDFDDYGNDEDSRVHHISGGRSKHSDSEITISTWESIYKLDKEYFKQFKTIIVDECHGAKANSIKSLMEKATDCVYRFGFTGTLDNIQCNKLVIEGLFGPIRVATTTKKLIENKHASNFRIKAIVLKYPIEISKQVTMAKDYQTEIDAIVGNKSRNEFIKKLVFTLPGNTLLLFRLVSKHGKELLKLLKDENSGRNIYYVSGEIKGEDREKIRKVMESETNAIIIASEGCFSTGVNIPNLHNLIFSSPSKARIRNLQSIGRVLRLHESKTIATLYDIADDLSYKGNRNYTLNHFSERIKIYITEGFEYKIIPYSLK